MLYHRWYHQMILFWFASVIYLTLSAVALWPAGTPEWSSRHPMKSWLMALEFALWQHCRNTMRSRNETHVILSPWWLTRSRQTWSLLCAYLCFWRRWTTTYPTRSRYIVMACRRGSWDWWSSMKFHSWSNVSRPSPTTIQSLFSLWSKNASPPPSTPACQTTLAHLRLELFWITPSLKETGQCKVTFNLFCWDCTHLIHVLWVLQ